MIAFSFFIFQHFLFLFLAPRSGLTLYHKIDVVAGVVDCDYDGVVLVIMSNRSKQPYIVEQGKKIAQLICEKIAYPRIVEVEKLASVSIERGIHGFGSSGY